MLDFLIGGNMCPNKECEYIVQLVMLKKLYAHKKISDDEFKAIKSSLDSIYKVSHIELS